MNPRDAVLQKFREHFGTSPTFLARAPGRVNLIGEHTDYNDGFVLPAAIDRAVWIATRPRPGDTLVHMVSVDFDAQITFSLYNLDDPDLPHWSLYPRGALWWLQEHSYPVPAFDAVMGGDIPIGAGLSSSAAVELVTLELGLALADAQMPQLQKALAGVEVEHQFVGVPCGVMDQMASAMGQTDHALLIDCRSLETTPVPVPTEASLVILDTGKRRGLVSSEYAARREQCEAAARVLGVEALRDATLADVEAARARLGDVLYRRARHVVSENQRVLDTVAALRAGDLAHVGELLHASHISLRDDYAVSCAELDAMAEIANAQAGCYGARMTGAGFGGCAVALVATEAVSAFVEAVAPAYHERTGLAPQLYVCRAAAGSSIEHMRA